MHQRTIDTVSGAPQREPSTTPPPAQTPEPSLPSMKPAPTHPVEIDRKLIEQLPPAHPDPDDPVCD